MEPVLSGGPRCLRAPGRVAVALVPVVCLSWALLAGAQPPARPGDRAAPAPGPYPFVPPAPRPWAVPSPFPWMIPAPDPSMAWPPARPSDRILIPVDSSGFDPRFAVAGADVDPAMIVGPRVRGLPASPAPTRPRPR